MRYVVDHISIVYHYASMYGFPRGADQIGGSGISDRTANLALNLATNHADDPAVIAAKELDGWLLRLQKLARDGEFTVRKAQPQHQIDAGSLDICTECQTPKFAQDDRFVLGLCRKCYDKSRYKSAKKMKEK